MEIVSKIDNDSEESKDLYQFWELFFFHFKEVKEDQLSIIRRTITMCRECRYYPEVLLSFRFKYEIFK